MGDVPPLAGSKQLRDAEDGVRIEFLVPVAFPDPAEVGEVRDGISYIRLPTLIELKLASGMTGGPHRGKDLVDVFELVKAIDLPREFAEQLNPYVRDRYLETWAAVQEPPPEL